ncbi:heme A synthase [candidate division KSB1 bacterium]
MSFFRRFAFLATSATYLLIFIGGLVRVSGAGLGCPDWPKCFGRWMPPLSRAQLPADIDPVLFNITLSWIEYINRLFGVLIGILIFITALLAVKYYRNVKSIVMMSMGAVLLTGFQGWYGSIVVSQKLNPFAVSVHMGIALIIVSMLIYVTQKAYYLEFPEIEKNAVYPGKIMFMTGGLWILSVIQIVLGTRVRAGIEIETEIEPLAGIHEIIERVGSVENLHALLGIGLLFGTIHVGVSILKHSQNPSLIMRQGVWAMIVLVLAQLTGALVIVLTDLPAIMQLFHLWTASLYIGMVTVVMIAFLEGKGEKIQ